jgi:hypothetical protein
MGRILRVFRKSRAETELDRELRFHLEKQIADNIAAGMPPPKKHGAMPCWNLAASKA